MIRQNQRLLNMLNAASDMIVVICIYWLSSWLWLDVFKDSQNMASVRFSSPSSVVISCVYALVIVLLLGIFRMYNSSRIRRMRFEILIVWEVNAIGILLVGSLLYLFRLQDFSRGVLGLFLLLNSLVLSCKRVLLHQVLSKMRSNGFNQKHVLVVGTGRLARQYAEDIRSERGLGFHLVGFIGEPNDELDVLDDFDALDKHLQGAGIDEVIIALDPSDLDRLRAMIMVCETCGTKVSVIPFYNDIIPSNPTIECIGRTKLINLRANPLDNLGWAAVKRAADVVASALLLALLSPLMLFAAIGTLLSSPGPVFFRQERVGRNKTPFIMLKFRSMRVNPKEATAWTTDADPRKTKFGSFLRKFSIDELPQLINVLRGEMSLIGPRPEIPYFVEQFRDSVPLYMVKHQVRPGMTGWAQVHGYRGDTSIVKRIEYDIWYIEHWSIGLDLKILLMTVFGGWVNHEQLATEKASGAENTEHHAG